MGDLDLARTRIEQLQHLNDILLAELTRTKGRGSKGIVGFAAKGISSLLLAVGLGVVGGAAEGIGTAAYNDWVSARHQADKVVEACGYDVTVNFDFGSPPTSTPPPTTSPATAPAAETAEPAPSPSGPAGTVSVGAGKTGAVQHASPSPATVDVTTSVPTPSVGSEAQRVQSELPLTDDLEDVDHVRGVSGASDEAQHGRLDDGENLAGESTWVDDGPDVLDS